ncbi:TPR-like protein [Cenococcum geophilum 1.58]|uniref:TPR-like protein n=1 Tax=Cenococcum geophilum 1.58 TaxID=794803 RepID=A0ACC8EL85_9PEZI|nr:TPR-like protein [Cenococcum geophilum 1.58]
MFIGRENVMAEINKKYEQTTLQNHTRLALVGLGGVGKSQIAIEYAYRVRDSAPQTSVFWVHASNAARFEKDYREIADKIELPGRNDPRADILRLVSGWLSNEKNGRWLMILDNADDDDVFFHFDGDTEQITRADNVTSRKMPLASFLPQTPNGSILVTSRNLAAATSLVGMDDNVIRVEPMDEGDALALLKTRVPFDEPSKGNAKALVQALECIPLAITHAAAYIRMREPRVTISTYLKLFRESTANQATLLSSEDARDLRRDHSIQHAAITTWQISFNQIQKIKPAATDLLALISMFDRQGIPEYLLHDNTNQLQFEDAIAPLTSFALVRAQVQQQSFEMHRLVQLSTRKWLEQNHQLEKWRKESVRIMARVFPSGEPETWTDCQVLLPHSKEVLSHALNDEDKDEALHWASVARDTLRYLYQRGEYAAAEQIGRAAVEAMEKVLGPEHTDTLASVSELSSALERLGKYKEAEAMHQRALEGSEKVLGPEHRGTLIIVSELGSVLEILGKYKEAEAMHRRALEGSEKVLGPEHQDTLVIVSRLGSVLEKLGKYKEVEAMHRRALEGSEKVLGPEHRDTLVIVSRLGSALEILGKYKEAEAMHRRALEGSEKVLGPEHRATLTIVSELGSVLEILGKYKEAEAMHRRALEGNEKVLGPEHRDTLVIVSRLGSVLEKLGKYKEVEAMHQRVLEGMEKVLGPEHPDTLTAMAYLASAFSNQGRWKEAEKLGVQALEITKRVLGQEHPNTLTIMNNLAITWKSLGRNSEALALIDECVQLQEQILGSNHPYTVSSLRILNNWKTENLVLNS